LNCKGDPVNHHVVLETFASLTAQITLLICVAAWVTRKKLLPADTDTCWAAVHICILLLTVAAFFLPHLRWITWADLDQDGANSLTDVLCSTAGRFCTWAWLTGTAVIIAVCIAGMFRATSLIWRSVVDDNIEDFLRGVVPTLASSTAPIGIRISPNDVSPFCWQFHYPCIVIPSALKDFPAAEQAAIVRHELAHLRLQHPLHLFLQRIVEAVYWFHPLVWWASREAAAAREFRCDRDSVHSRADVADYLRSLLRLIESPLKPPERLPAGVGFLGDASLLSRRANALAETLGHASTSPAQNRTAIAALAIMGVLCSFLWLPVNPSASRRADWSPWPSWSAQALNATGLSVRDYEIDGHRLNPREYRE
jgi:bla regulator protein BlaR1